MRTLQCKGCEKIMAEIRDGRVIPSLVVYCETCHERIQYAIAKAYSPRADLPDFMRGFKSGFDG